MAEQVALYVARAHNEWQVCMSRPYDTWLAVFPTQKTATKAMNLLLAHKHWCLQPDKLAELPDVWQVNTGLGGHCG